VKRSLSPEELGRHDFHRILLIKPSSLGDVVHALPVLHGLRRRYPSATIDWLISTALAPLLEGHPDLDKLVPFDRRRYAQLAWNPWAAAEFAAFVRRLRAAKYDLVIELQGLFRTGFFARTTGASVRIGPSDAREGASWFYSHRIPSRPADTHAADRNLAVAELLGFEDAPLEFNLGLTDTDRASAADLLSNARIGDARPLIAVLPGARWDTKMWPAERFAQVIDELQENQGRCVLIGGPNEQGLCRRVGGLCRTRPADLCGRTGLRQMAAILERADLVLGHDSGPMHVAVALGRPVVCIIGPTNPTRTGPYRCPDSIVRLDLDCAPCYFKKLSQCPYDHRCMRELEPDRVTAAVQRALHAKSTTQAADIAVGSR
jgi:lipopolysaccharide heptosyltransferase I